MSSESCIEMDLDICEAIEGEAIKVFELSFLGDVDKSNGVIISSDSGCLGCNIGGKILIVERFRGSTVGTYVLYSLCKKGVGPKAIICVDPDPVVVAGAALCGIPMVYGLPKQFIQRISTGDKVRIERRGGIVCIKVEGGF